MSYSAPGIFNALDDWGSGHGLQFGSSRTIAQENTQSLRATIQAAINSCESGYSYGAIILIPSNSDVPPPVNALGTTGTGADWFFAATDEGDVAAITIDCPYPLLFLGCGDATTLHMKSYTDFDNNKHLFLINNASLTDPDANIGGVTFQDLQLKYDGDLNGGAAIFAQSSQNVRVFRCIINNVPAGIIVQDTANFSLLECTCFYPVNGSGVLLTIGSSDSGPGSSQAYIEACNFRVSGGSGGGATTGLLIDIVDGLICRDVHFDGMNTVGININPGGPAKNLTFENCVLHGQGTQLSLSPVSGGTLQNVAVVNCSFLNSSSGDEDAASAVVVNPVDGNAAVDTLRFVSSVCLTNPAYGLEINAGQNIEVLGGSYSANGQLMSGAGIWLNGSPKNVRIIKVACLPTVYGVAIAQQYGIVIGNGCSNIFILDCDLNGYPGTPPAPISFGSSLTNVQVVDCPGYNDQEAVVSSAAPAAGSFFSGLSFSPPYFGPVAFYVTSGNGSVMTGVDIQTNSTGLATGSFFLPPGSTVQAKLHYSTSITGHAPPFLMVGE